MLCCIVQGIRTRRCLHIFSTKEIFLFSIPGRFNPQIQSLHIWRAECIFPPFQLSPFSSCNFPSPHEKFKGGGGGRVSWARSQQTSMETAAKTECSGNSTSRVETGRLPRFEISVGHIVRSQAGVNYIAKLSPEEIKMVGPKMLQTRHSQARRRNIVN